MNNFIKIFASIKKHCGEPGANGAAPLNKIDEEIEITNGMDSIYQYLDVLQDLGMIQYSVHANKIALTEKGEATEHLFT